MNDDYRLLLAFTEKHARRASRIRSVGLAGDRETPRVASGERPRRLPSASSSLFLSRLTSATFLRTPSCVSSCFSKVAVAVAADRKHESCVQYVPSPPPPASYFVRRSPRLTFPRDLILIAEYPKNTIPYFVCLSRSLFLPLLSDLSETRCLSTFVFFPVLLLFHGTREIRVLPHRERERD